MPSTQKTIVVLGASSNPGRASNMLVERLAFHDGYVIVPVHPALESVAGIPVRRALDEVPPRPDLLTLYVGAERSSALQDEILRLNPRKVIFNPGAENPGLETSLRSAGIATESACSLVLLSQGLL